MLQITTSPAVFRAWRMSYGIATTKAQQAQVIRLARSVKAIHPGIYKVGACTVSLWSGSCTCKQARKNQRRPCAHKLALRLAEQVNAFEPMSESSRAYFAAAGIDEPEQIATYAKIKNLWPGYNARPFKGGFYRVVNIENDWAFLEGANGLHVSCHKAQLTHITPAYVS